jgi:hypothetical protein
VWSPEKLKKYLIPIGSALDALQGMIDLINARPKGFGTLDDAIEWQLSWTALFFPSLGLTDPTCWPADDSSLRSKTLNNAQSARISVPSLFVDTDPNDDDDLPDAPVHPKSSSSRYRWITELAQTQPFWEGQLLSQKIVLG